MNENAIKTVAQLKQWLVENCYSFNSYSLDGNSFYEGFGLQNTGKLYQWYYTERGSKDVIKEFTSQEDAVAYALEAIKANTFTHRKFIALFKSDEELEEFLAELKKRDVEYETDKILYSGTNDWRTRVYVIGCGYKKIQDLIKKHYE